MDLIERRRKLLTQQDDKRIWLIKNGIDIVSNTGGYECSTKKVSNWQMSGWSSQMPTLSQNNGFLRLSVTGRPVYGSLIPQSYFPISKIIMKTLYLDASVTLTNNSYFHLVMRSEDEINYYPNIHSDVSFDRQIKSCLIEKGVKETFNSVIFPMQISTRETSYIDIYNMWIE